MPRGGARGGEGGFRHRRGDAYGMRNYREGMDRGGWGVVGVGWVLVPRWRGTQAFSTRTGSGTEEK